jgi:hypothetical protein
MSFLSLWLLTVLLLAPAMAADIPCGYNETGFHEIAAPDAAQEQPGAVTLNAFSLYQGGPLTGVPQAHGM